MSAVTELNPRLLAVTEAGVSVWLDQIRRSMIEGGELARMVAVESLRGVTSNPAIFEKAILGSDDYDEDLRTLARENLDSVAIYEVIAIRDVQLAADVLAGVHCESGGRDGFVSLEVSPDLAHDTEGTYFGLVPAALMGVNIEALLHRCQVAEQMCAHYDSSESNSGLWFGAVIGELARRGRDKLTFLISPPIESFGLWAEQLVAESTGKSGPPARGIVPIVDEPLGDTADVYGDDRVFVYRRNLEHPEERLDAAIEQISAAGHPTVTLPAHGPADLGRIFFLTEFAVAVAGWALEINPFDQPNVQEAKDNTARVLSSGSVPSVAVAGDDQLRALLADARPPYYVAIMGYVAPSAAFDEAIADLRAAIRSATGAATTFGYGPRFLHSTGQLHKGGPPTARFLQLVDTPARDADIPGAGYSFGTLIAAQAAGDLETLRSHGLGAERVELEGDPVAAVRTLTARIKAILEGS